MAGPDGLTTEAFIDKVLRLSPPSPLLSSLVMGDTE